MTPHTCRCWAAPAEEESDHDEEQVAAAELPLADALPPKAGPAQPVSPRRGDQPNVQFQARPGAQSEPCELRRRERETREKERDKEKERND